MGHDRIQDLPVWRLRFADRPDLVVRVTIPTVEAEALAPSLVPLFTSGRRLDVVAAVAQLAAPFADSLLSWTLEWNGRPVPCTRRGVLRVDLDLLIEILQEWIGLWRATELEPAAPAAAREDERLAELPMMALVPDDVAELTDDVPAELAVS